MPSFGKASRDRLARCHRVLQILLEEAIKVYDFSIIEADRTKEKQEEMYRSGKSHLRYPNSKHNYYPSLAVDIAPYPIDWERRGFYFLAGVMFACAEKIQIEERYGYKLRWGGDWNRNMDFKDNKFDDLPHFELVEVDNGNTR